MDSQTLASFIIKRRWVILAVFALALASLIAIGLSLAGKPAGGGFVDPQAEASKAGTMLGRHGIGAPNLFLHLRPVAGAPEVAIKDAGMTLTNELAASPGVVFAHSPWNTKDPSLRSERGTYLVRAHVAGPDPAAAQQNVDQIVKRFAGRHGALDVSATGQAVVDSYAEQRTGADLLRAQLVVLPLTALVILFAYGTFTAAAVPMVVGLVTLAGSFTVVHLLARWFEVSIFALDLSAALGLGLALNYSLLMVSRFREGLARRQRVEQALATTVSRSGRTVLFSGLTVAAALSPLLLFGQPFVHSLGLSTLVVVLLTCLAALLLVPVLLALFGKAIGTRTQRQGDIWVRLTSAVLRRRWVVLVSVCAVLVVIGSPVLQWRAGNPDHRWLSDDAPPRLAAMQIAEDFPLALSATPLIAVPARSAGDPEVEAIARELSKRDGVVSVITAANVFEGGRISGQPPKLTAPPSGGTWLAVATKLDPNSDAARDLVSSVRDHRVPMLVTGLTAALIDSEVALRDTLPVAIAMTVLCLMLLMALLTRSIVLPVKAVLANFASLLAAFGAMIFLFQQGHLGWLIGHSATEVLHPLTLVIVFAITFGVSMDYEVLVVARIREEHLSTGDNDRAIVAGMSRTARLVAASATVFVIPLAALMSSELTLVKMIGAVLAIAIVIDATLIRCLLVPSFMGIAGRWNWWLPGQRGRPFCTL